MDIGIHIINPNEIYKVTFKDTPKGPSHIPDIVALAQKITKLMLTTSGSDLYAEFLEGESIGGNLKELLKNDNSYVDIGVIRGQLKIMLKKIVSFIKKKQENQGLMDSAKLKEAYFTKIERDPKTFILILEIQVINEAEERFITFIDTNRIYNFV